MSSAVFPNLYTKGSRIWIPNQEEVWKLAYVKEDFKEENKSLIVYDEDNKETTLTINDLTSLPPLRNPDILIGANDLTSLSYLHEPAVLYNLRVRFLDQNLIYTWCGIVLVAVNPFTDLDIYGDQTIQTYHQSSGSSNLDPHVYAVAEDAYTKLERENTNQSIIVSGESGAGKTVSAKFAMRYFASIAGSHSTNIENRVLASNPIMEAIGNAKTTRNDNSSRFGKYIQIMFDPQTRSIIGGNMRTYLLEKSRVSRLNYGERNFHIFYQLCTYCKQNNIDHLRLKDEYNFVFLGEIIPDENDDISKFLNAIQCLGFNEKQQNIIFQVIAAVLHSGNIKFISLDDEQCTIDPKDYHLNTFCSLLGLDPNATLKWLTNKVIRLGRSEIIVTPVNLASARYGRDALAKYIYEKMFLWIVSLINKVLGSGDKCKLSNTFIGVLDIYGFEHFDTNSFEQFCINYGNEVLQQQFNQHVFKLEQEEYVREGIDWTFIQFTDNKPVIDLIETKPLGILNLLDEECKMPKGTDETWCAKLYAQLAVGTVFQKPKIGSRNSFIIQHFADKVLYQVEGFLEKNRDTVWEEQIDLLKRSDIIGTFFLEESTDSQPKSGGKIKVAAHQQQKQQKLAKATVGSQFRDSLAALMAILNGTTPHYIRCIKPNDVKGAFDFNNIRAIQQLRACGVLETIKISSNGFPSRWTYSDFAIRYRVLLFGMSKKTKNKAATAPVENRKLVRASSISSEAKSICTDIINLVFEQQVYPDFKTSIDDAQNRQQKLYQCGRTKIFFRSGQVAFLERIRAQRLRECATLLQKNIKGWLARIRYVKIKACILRLQSLGRGIIARRLYWHLKTTKAAILIQKNWRCYIAQKKYLQLQKAALGIQKYGRALIARRTYMSMKMHKASIIIQKNVRMFLAKRHYKRKICQIVIVQSQVRRWLAKRVLKKLKVEARSVEHVKLLNKGLEIKIIELQQKIQSLTSEVTKMKQKEIELGDFRNEKAQMEIEIKNLKNKLSDNECEIRKLVRKIEEDHMIIDKYAQQIETKNEELKELKKVETIIEKTFDPVELEKCLAEKEKELYEKFERERRILLDERESEKTAHQQLLRKYAALEDRMLSNDRMSDYDEKGPDISTVSLMMRLSELEQENAKVKHENQEMRDAFAKMSDPNKSDSAASLLAQQCATLQSELDRVREERTNLKTIVLGQEFFMKEPNSENEVFSAFRSIIKQMERDIECERRAKELAQQKIDSLVNGSDSSILRQSMNADSQVVFRLVQEKTLVEQKLNRILQENNNLKLQLMRNVASDKKDGTNDTAIAEKEMTTTGLGMFKFSLQDESLILRVLVLDLDPSVALKFPPHLPITIIFMCVRYSDYVNDENMVRSLFNNLVLAIRRVTRKHPSSLDHVVLWLSNVCKMVTFLRQYSGDPNYDICEESLKNFDLSEYRQVFCDLAYCLHTNLIKYIKEVIQQLIVPAILEHEALASSGIYSQPNIHRTGSVSEQDSLPTPPIDRPNEVLIKELSILLRTVLIHIVDPELIQQTFKQIYYFICASALNNLLLRKDLCNMGKAMQIRFNLSSLEQWAREQIPNSNEVLENLEPIIQATKILQTKKNESNLDTIVEMCNRLTSSQIMKLLTLYTPGEGEVIPPKFIKQLQLHLASTRINEVNNKLLMDNELAFTVNIPYTPSIIKFQSITLPEILLNKGLGTVLMKFNDIPRCITNEINIPYE